MLSAGFRKVFLLFYRRTYFTVLCTHAKEECLDSIEFIKFKYENK